MTIPNDYLLDATGSVIYLWIQRRFL